MDYKHYKPRILSGIHIQTGKMRRWEHGGSSRSHYRFEYQEWSNDLNDLGVAPILENLHIEKKWNIVLNWDDESLLITIPSIGN